MTEKVLGFDIRTCDPQISATLWDDLRRSYYLLRPEIECPLSVDTAVLPNIFKYHFDEQDTWDSRKIDVTGHGAHQCVLRLWNRFDAMQEIVATGNSSGEPLTNRIIIGITVGDIDVKLLRNSQWREVLDEPVDPPELEDNWELLGFDLADDWLVSGLSNCIFEERKKDSFSAKWAPRINGYGLLGGFDDALDFKNVLDHGVSEHAPFIVCGVYRYRDGS